MNHVTKTDKDWRAELTPEQYRILRQQGTEPSGTGALLHNHDDGRYGCAGCGAALFSSEAKFDSGTGWPSFDRPADWANVKMDEDRKFGVTRTEVTCQRCGGHLGHVFPDGPTDTGQRFCINSAALEFNRKDDA